MRLPVTVCGVVTSSVGDGELLAAFLDVDDASVGNVSGKNLSTTDCCAECEGCMEIGAIQKFRET